MTVSRLRATAWAVWWTTLALALAQAAIALTQEVQLLDAEGGLADFPILTVGVVVGATIGLLVLRSQPRNVVAWIFLTCHCVNALGLAASGYGLRATETDWAHKTAGHVALLISLLAGAPYVLTMLGLVFLLFPAGRAPSARWRKAAWACVGCLAVYSAGVIAATWPVTTLVRGTEATGVPSGILNVSGTGLFMFLTAFACSMFRRTRRAVGDERLQLRTLCFAAVLLVAATLAVLIDGVGLEVGLPAWVPQAGLQLAYTGVSVAAGLAILKYRLYDIDVIINRTLVVGMLAVLVGAAYSGLVVMAGRLVGSETSSWPWLVSMVLIALAFQPARAYVQRFVDRLLYGERATPYEVLADMGRRLSAAVSSEELLPRLATGVGTGVGAIRSRATLVLPDGDSVSTNWPPESEHVEFAHSVPITYHAESVGELAFTMPAGHPLTASGARLVSDLAKQAGLAMHNMRLTAALQRQLHELELQGEDVTASRQRILTAQQAARQRVQHDISIGTELPLQRVRGALDELLEQPDIDAAATADQLAALADDVGVALDRLRDVARGIFPALLAERGLVAALRSFVDDLAIPVRLDVGDDGRPDPAVEAALYFCCVQALRSAKVHGASDDVGIEVRTDGAETVLSIANLGGRTGSVSLLQSLPLQDMADRIEALGGSIDVRANAAGVDVTARVAARQPAFTLP